MLQSQPLHSSTEDHKADLPGVASAPGRHARSQAATAASLITIVQVFLPSTLFPFLSRSPCLSLRRCTSQRQDMLPCSEPLACESKAPRRHFIASTGPCLAGAKRIQRWSSPDGEVWRFDGAIALLAFSASVLPRTYWSGGLQGNCTPTLRSGSPFTRCGRISATDMRYAQAEGRQVLE